MRRFLIPQTPLKRGLRSNSRVQSPPFQGGFRGISRVYASLQTCVYTAALERGGAELSVTTFNFIYNESPLSEGKGRIKMEGD
jgi:hypothetical protein